MSGVRVSDKLQTYFHDLAPEARTMLATALARAGEGLPHAGLIVSALRNAMVAHGEASPPGDIADLVFEPCRPFTVPAVKAAKAPGVIRADSFGPVWRWLEKDAASAAITALRASADADMSGAPSPRAVATARSAVARAIVEALKAVAHERRGGSRLNAQLSSDTAVEDLDDIAAALRHADLLAETAEGIAADLRLPPDDVAPTLRHRLTALARKAKPAHPLALNLLMTRLNNPVAAIRLLVVFGGLSSADQLMDTPHGALLARVMFDAECAVARAQDARSKADAAELAAAIREFGIQMRAIGAELELDSRGAIAKRINTLRKGMSQAVSSRLTDVTQRVKSLVRPRADSKRGPATMPDAAEIERLHGDISVLMAARNYADDIALKADTSRIYGELRELLDTGAPLLIDRLRILPHDERGPLRERLDAVVRISRRLLGDAYASLLTKSVQVADTPPPKQKKAAAG